jgi:hypothetical protein
MLPVLHKDVMSSEVSVSVLQVSIQNLDDSLNSCADPEGCWQLYRSILSFYSHHAPTSFHQAAGPS